MGNVLYQRLSSPRGRAMSVIFSKSAVVRTVGGQPHIALRFCEMREHPLLDVYVRAYCLTRVRDPFVIDGVSIKLIPLDLSEPNGDLAEGRVLPCLPVTVVHK